MSECLAYLAYEVNSRRCALEVHKLGPSDFAYFLENYLENKSPLHRWIESWNGRLLYSVLCLSRVEASSAGKGQLKVLYDGGQILESSSGIVVKSGEGREILLVFF